MLQSCSVYTILVAIVLLNSYGETQEALRLFLYEPLEEPPDELLDEQPEEQLLEQQPQELLQEQPQEQPVGQPEDQPEEQLEEQPHEQPQEQPEEPPMNAVRYTLYGLVLYYAVDNVHEFIDAIDGKQGLYTLTPDELVILEDFILDYASAPGDNYLPNENGLYINPVEFFMYFITNWYYAVEKREPALTTNYLRRAVKVACRASKQSIFLHVFDEDDVNWLDWGGDSAINNAIRFEEPTLARLWIDAGLDVTQKNYYNQFTALHMAVEVKNCEIIKRLIPVPGVSINLGYPEGQSPLELAIKARQSDQDESDKVLKCLCKQLTEPGRGIGYAMAFAFRSQHEATIKDIVSGINETLVTIDVNNDKVSTFLRIWTDLLQLPFLKRMSNVIVVHVDNGRVANVEVDAIDKLYRLVFRRDFVFTEDCQSCAAASSPSELDRDVDMMSKIAYVGSGGIQPDDQMGRIRVHDANADGGKMSLMLIQNEAEVGWTVDDLKEKGFVFEVVENGEDKVGTA